MNELITFETWVSFQADRMKDEGDGTPRIRFSIPVHTDLQSFMNDPDRKEIGCIYRIRARFYWGQMGPKASIRLSGYVETGPKGGQWFHCKNVEILEGQPRLKVDNSTKRMVAKMAKKAGVELPKKAKKKKQKRSGTVPPQPTLFG